MKIKATFSEEYTNFYPEFEDNSELFAVGFNENITAVMSATPMTSEEIQYAVNEGWV